jgi:hypothetical protein
MRYTEKTIKSKKRIWPLKKRITADKGKTKELADSSPNK